ncbi:MAG: alpha/beta fold hydrolase [Deltaproteobacteria bacterium]|nr:alpha/beta fold hydrolase [Deltaproteobacteria bacterium]
MRISALGLLLALLTSVAACGTADDDDDGGTTDRNRGVGQPCEDPRNCRAGLQCLAGACQPCACNSAGATCQLTGECMEGLYCAPSGNCEPAGDATAGGACSTTADCEAGLVCLNAGFSAQCGPAGGGDLGAPCVATAECLAGLACSDRGVCAIGLGASPLPLPPLWTGVECPPDDVSPRAYFVVPRGDPMADGDFFRLPFPNDIRGGAGTPDLSDFPSPGTQILPIDLVRRYADASTEDLDGWGTNETAFFRFSVAPDFGSVRAGDDSFTAAIVNVDPDSPEVGQQRPLAWYVTSGGGRYICPKIIGVRPLVGFPLLPSTTYAVVVTTGVRAEDGSEYQRDPDFVAMLGASAPSDGVLAAAWEAYAPLRSWLESDGRAPETLLNAAVFTTQDTERLTRNLRDVVRAQPAPVVSELVVCDEGVASPCDDGLMGDAHERGCFAADPGFVEVHARVTVPFFQTGTLPFEEPEDGGGIEYDGAGNPRVVRTEEVCMALMLPRGEPPPEGWPVAIYAHGTGGSFRSSATSGVASELTTGVPNIAVIAIDQPQHGDRRGGSTRSPEELFYNFVNPHAARDNIVQGAAELFQLVRVAEGLDLPPAMSPTSARVAFDDTRILLFAHSQGGTHASLFLPYEPLVTAALLSGNGGDLVQSLLNKREPIDIAAVVPAVLADPGPNPLMPAVDEFHPALQIFGAYFDAVDPVNFGRVLANPPMGGVTPHMFATVGDGDTYSPENTLVAYVRAAGLDVVPPRVLDFGGVFETSAPASGNQQVLGQMRTRVFREYRPDGYDGHFVAWRNPQGLRDVVGFLRDAARGEIPVVGAP